MNRYILAEANKCIGCNTCMAACSLVHQAQGLLEHPRLTVMRDSDGTAPVACRHCEDMPCAKVCPVNAITTVNDSIRVNESTCIGCKLCGLACPFGAITPAAGKPAGHPDTYEQYVPESALADIPGSTSSASPFLSWKAGQRVIAVKCDLCYFRNQGPACIQICPTAAIKLVKESDLKGSNKKRRLESLSLVAEENAGIETKTAEKRGENG